MGRVSSCLHGRPCIKVLESKCPSVSSLRKATIELLLFRICTGHLGIIIQAHEWCVVCGVWCVVCS
jgi:hypothetical protein